MKKELPQSRRVRLLNNICRNEAEDSMKIVNIIGGLGNQMFQYALAIALRQKNPEESVFIDISHFHGYHLHSGFELQRIFDIQLPIAKRRYLMRLTYYIPQYLTSRFFRRILPRRKHEYIEQSAYRYDEKVLSVHGNCYFEGYWQSPKYFEHYRSIVINTFRFSPFTDLDNKTTEMQMKEENSVALHVRRGDYLREANYMGICTLDYYRKAIETAVGKIQSPRFFIFSNDIDWCKDNIVPMIQKYDVSFIDFNVGKNSYRDMHLMSLARCCIVANSSFSWWGAWLNERNDKIVIAPSRWVNESDSKDIYPSDWLLIESADHNA